LVPVFQSRFPRPRVAPKGPQNGISFIYYIQQRSSDLGIMFYFEYLGLQGSIYSAISHHHMQTLKVFMPRRLSDGICLVNVRNNNYLDWNFHRWLTSLR